MSDSRSDLAASDQYKPLTSQRPSDQSASLCITKLPGSPPPPTSLELGHQTTLLVAQDRLFHASQGALVLVYSGLITMFPSSCDSL